MATLRKLFALVLILIAYQSYGQQPQVLGTRRSRIIVPNQLQVDSLFVLPGRVDTNFVPYKAGAVVYRLADAKIYYHNGTKWQPIFFGATVSETDPTVSAAIKNASASDTTRWGKLYVDSIKRSSDSVYYYIGGSRFFGFKDSTSNITGKIDSVKRKVGSDSVFYYRGATQVFAFRDSLGTGEITTGTNLGSGGQVFQAKVGVDFRFRTLLAANSNLTVTQNTNDLTLQVKNFVDSVRKKSGTDSVFFYSGGVGSFAFVDLSTASGEANTASNVGSGTGLFKAKSGVDLQFKSLTSDTTIALTGNTNDVELKVDQTRIASVKRLQDSLVVIRGITANGLQGILSIGNQKITTIIDTAVTALNRTGWQGYPANRNTSYGTYGTAGEFGALGWQQFNGVNPSGRPNVVGMFWGYNVQPDGGRIITGDGAFRFGTETHYETGPEKLFELHLPEFIDTAGVYHRLFSSYLDKTGKRANLWQSEGDGIQFNKWGDQNTSYARIAPGSFTTYRYTRNDAYPYLELGAITDSIAFLPWASKWNFKISVNQQTVTMGRPSAVAADGATILLNDKLTIGSTSAAGRRQLEVYGNTVLREGSLSVDHLSGSGDAMTVSVAGSNKMTVGTTISTYATIFSNGNLLALVGSVHGTVGGNSLVSTIFEANSSSKSAMLPILTTTARNSLSVPQTAMIHYNSDSSNYEFRDGSGFKTFASREWVRSIYTAIPSQTGNSGKYLTTDGTSLSWAAVSGGSGTPGGSDEQIQVNNAGVFAGYANLTWKNASTSLGLGSSGTTAYLNVAAGTTSKALFNFGTGAAPSSPSGGDFWFDVSDSSFKYRIGSNSLKWLFSKDQVISTGLLLKPGAGLVADTLMVGGGTAGQALISNGSTSAATWTDLPAFAEGTYTATVTNVTNVASSSVTTCNYTRRGNYIEVFGEITIDPTATGDTKLRISLPVATGITNSYELSGQATTFDNVQSVRIYHELGEAVFRLNASVDASSHVYSFRFIYKYIAP